ncbi:MAG: hypothetical protein LDL26_00360 [Caenispirillum bisanense]|nr:hypothetical protein [Caenispirillum bisanense]
MVQLLMALLRGLKWIGGLLLGTNGLGIAIGAASLAALLTVGQDLAVWVFDEALGVVVLALGSVVVPDFPTPQDLVDAVLALGVVTIDVGAGVEPMRIDAGGVILWVWSQLAFGPALAIVAAAVGVKLVLRLIPFVRL